MGNIKHIQSNLKKLYLNAINPKGRTGRVDYIVECFLIGLICLIPITIVREVTDLNNPFLLFFLVTVFPRIRRLHDLGISGWWQLLILIPGGIGGILHLLAILIPGQKSANKYGATKK